MITTRHSTPTYYTDKSRDFQLFGHIFDAVANSSFQRSNAILNEYVEGATDKEFVDLLAKTLNFNTSRKYDHNALEKICFAFKYLMKNKGTKTAVRDLVNVMTKVYGIVYDYGQFVTFTVKDANGVNQYLIDIYLPEEVKDIALMVDVLDYILPTGFLYKIHFVGISTVIQSEAYKFNEVLNTIQAQHNELSQITTGKENTVYDNHYSSIVNVVSTPNNDSLPGFDKEYLVIPMPIASTDGGFNQMTSFDVTLELNHSTDYDYSTDKDIIIVYKITEGVLTPENGVLYQSPIRIRSNCTLQYMALGLDGKRSEIGTQICSVGRASNVTITPDSGFIVYNSKISGKYPTFIGENRLLFRGTLETSGLYRYENFTSIPNTSGNDAYFATRRVSSPNAGDFAYVETNGNTLVYQFNGDSWEEVTTKSAAQRCLTVTLNSGSSNYTIYFTVSSPDNIVYPIFLNESGRQLFKDQTVGDLFSYSYFASESELNSAESEFIYDDEKVLPQPGDYTYVIPKVNGNYDYSNGSIYEYNGSTWVLNSTATVISDAAFKDTDAYSINTDLPYNFNIQIIESSIVSATAIGNTSINSNVNTKTYKKNTVFNNYIFNDVNLS